MKMMKQRLSNSLSMSACAFLCVMSACSMAQSNVVAKGETPVTIFMTTFFIGGSLGTFFSGLGWSVKGWLGVCLVGGFFASATLLLCVYEQLFMKQQEEKE